ncbi:MAG TPA: aspartate aminotransferase family protein, partial [Dehalococcoidia bacterium]|nr:aspartate aminotransferase family protein [Dehalococcoidia bacterium]
MTSKYSEEELLDMARKFSFRSRMDRNAVSGPIMVWGRGSVVRDVNGKEYLDFNSGQMCAA